MACIRTGCFSSHCTPGRDLRQVEEELSSVAQLMNESKDFNNFVVDPSVPRATKIDGLNAILTKMGATDITKNFIGGCCSSRVLAWRALAFGSASRGAGGCG